MLFHPRQLHELPDGPFSKWINVPVLLEKLTYEVSSPPPTNVVPAGQVGDRLHPAPIAVLDCESVMTWVERGCSGGEWK